MACTRMFHKRLVSPLFYTAPCNHFGTETHTVTHIGLGLSDSSFRTPGRTWTCDPLLRRQTLYPTELRVHFISASWWIRTTESPGGGRFTVSRNWPLSETSISKTFVGLREFQLLSGLPPLRCRATCYCVLNAGPIPYHYWHRTTLGPCFGSVLFLAWFQHSYKTGGTSRELS